MQYELFESFNTSRVARAVRNDIRDGDAAEAYVLAKLLRFGVDAHDARRDAVYDLTVNFGGNATRLIQVKHRKRPCRASDRWPFTFVRGNPRTGGGTYAYEPTDFHIAACVALSLEKVLLFVAGVHSSIRFTTADFLRENAEFESWERALEIIARGERH